MTYMLKDSMGYRINLAATILRTAFTKTLQPICGIAAEQFATLKIIDENRDVTQTFIAECLKKDKTTIGRSIESLIKKGLINKRYERSDKRACNISLTQAGRDILQMALPVAEDFNKNIKNKFSKEEVEIFFTILDTILEKKENR